MKKLVSFVVAVAAVMAGLMAMGGTAGATDAALHQRKEARPSQLTGDRVGLGTRRRRTQGALPLSYARPGLMWMWCRAAGFEPATTRLKGEGTPACASGRLGCRASSFGCEARIRTRISWFRARRGASCTTSHRSGWRDSNSQPPAPRAGALPLRHVQ